MSAFLLLSAAVLDMGSVLRSLSLLLCLSARLIVWHPRFLVVQEEEIPELEIDIDELLEISDEDQRTKLQEMLQECCKPTDDFINELLIRIKGLRKMTVSQKK